MKLIFGQGSEMSLGHGICIYIYYIYMWKLVDLIWEGLVFSRFSSAFFRKSVCNVCRLCFTVVTKDWVQSLRESCFDPVRFIGPLSRWAHDSKTAPRCLTASLRGSWKVFGVQHGAYQRMQSVFQKIWVFMVATRTPHCNSLFRDVQSITGILSISRKSLLKN